MLKILFSLLTIVLAKQTPDICHWHTHGVQYDLNPLKKQNNYQVPDTETSMGMFNMVYEFNFCTSSVKCQGREVAALEALEVMGKMTDNCDALGLRETQEFKYLNPSYPAQGIAVTYSQGDMCFDVKEDDGLEKIMENDQQMSMSPRSVSFEITCSSTNDENFHVIDSSKCNIRLGINHIVGCKEGAVPSIKWALFQIVCLDCLAYQILKILLIGSIIYFGGGTLYNQKKKDLKGMAAVPNIEQLKELPFLMKDGIKYSIQWSINILRRFQGKEQIVGSQGGYATV